MTVQELVDKFFQDAKRWNAFVQPVIEELYMQRRIFAEEYYVQLDLYSNEHYKALRDLIRKSIESKSRFADSCNLVAPKRTWTTHMNGLQEFFVATENRIRRTGENVPDWR